MMESLWFAISSCQYLIYMYTNARIFIQQNALCVHFQWYDLNCVENLNQRVSAQGKIHEFYMRWEASVC